MQQSGYERCLAAVRMPCYSYIADLTSLVRLHGLLLKNKFAPDLAGAANTKSGARETRWAGLAQRAS